jgi:hypothetical protein
MDKQRGKKILRIFFFSLPSTNSGRARNPEKKRLVGLQDTRGRGSQKRKGALFGKPTFPERTPIGWQDLKNGLDFKTRFYNTVMTDEV